jgi:hypothetical protein
MKTYHLEKTENPRMNLTRTFTSACSIAILSAAAIVGCKSGTATPTDTTPPPAVTPATQPSTAMPNQGKMPTPPVTLTKPDPATMTHVLTKDEPFYESMPGADAKAMGELKSGTKVLLMVPGAMYSKVLTDSGETVYTMTDGLDPIPPKK